MIMQTETRASHAPTRATGDDRPTLDDLAGMTAAELTTRYGRGTVPGSLHVLDGEPTCRMLAVRGLDAPRVARPLRRFAASARFPWAGKSFRAHDDGSGQGINRVRLGGERRWYPFATRIEPSALDGQPCILLDYDRPENPFFIRAIRDELREIAPGLFLGPALVTTMRRAPVLALSFACDTRR
jgi:hypothetical protein